MKAEARHLSSCSYRLPDVFDHPSPGSDTTAALEMAVRSDLFSRTAATMASGGEILRDEFPDLPGACCSFLRLAPGTARVVQFVVPGVAALETCASGGWLLQTADETLPSYWIPQRPFLRTLDAHGRILVEESAPVLGFGAYNGELSVALQIPGDVHLDWVVWRLPGGHTDLGRELASPLGIERQRAYLWSSKSTYRKPADLYLHLVNGHFYQNARAWPRKWKFCCELDAFELFVWMKGLELATGKSLYSALRRQILFSVISRQSADGGWYHGEWTDLNESHYRFHNGALLLLENALDEWDDALVRASLERGARYSAANTDKTDLGLWFLHDSLELSAAAMDQMQRETGALAKGFGAWRPSVFLGKSVTNKLVLNTHVDTAIALDRYCDISGDRRYEDAVRSAHGATEALLERRPAEWLYRIVFGLMERTMLPAAEAGRLSFFGRVQRRMAQRYLAPNICRIKHRFPRVVMPDGFLDRHLSPPYFGPNYHAVNLMDLVRLRRRLPEVALDRVVEDAIRFVVANDYAILRWWAEAGPRRFAIVVFAESLYQLYMREQRPGLRTHLAEAVLYIEDLGLGLPPSVLGANAEVVRRSRQVPCPSPADSRLRVVNLSAVDRREILLVNPTADELTVAWERAVDWPIAWTQPDGTSIVAREAAPCVRPRGWLWGRQESAAAPR